MEFAVIADIVGSRKLADRGRAQLTIESAVSEVEEFAPAVRKLVPTVGDEFQGVYADLASALLALALLQLRLPSDAELRFGIGAGEVRAVTSTADHTIEDGPGWWAARRAIETVHRLQEQRSPHARTWIASDDAASAEVTSYISSVNAYLIVRDHVVGGMGERARRLTYGSWLGRSQESLAADEAITQSAVSQALARAGSATLALGLGEITENVPEALR